MKKNIALILAFVIFALLFALSGCSEKTETETEKGLDYYYYIYRNYERYPATLMKYNLETCEETPLCPDPLCMHDSMDCPFCGVSNCFVDGYNVYYIRTSDMPEFASDGVAYLTESVCVFDYKNNKARELCSFKSDNKSSSQCDVVYYDGYVYFYRQTPDPDVVEYTLWRVNANGGKEENMGLSLPTWGSLHYGDRMITSDINTIYTSDMHGGERKVLITLDKAGSITLWNCTAEGILTYTIDYGDVSELWEMDIGRGKSKKLHATTDGIIKDICCFDDYVYFTVIARKSSVDPNSAERAVDRYGNTAYKVTHNGKCTEHFTETDAVISNMKRCGDKIMVFTVRLGDDGKAIREKHPIEK